MPREILFPTHLDALVVPPGETSPTADLAGTALFADGAPIGPGVHLHWALPDPLTEGRAAGDGAVAVDLPPVPDRWLVIRIAPPVKAQPIPPRATTAWVIDSVVGTATPLASWAAGAPPSTDQRLTVLGRFARGRVPIGDGEPEALATRAVYYPLARDRFGFHDRLDGVGAGHLSYVVIGWYADRGHDPLNVPAAIQAAWLQARRCLIDDGLGGAAGGGPAGGGGIVASPLGSPAVEAAASSHLATIAAAFRRVGITLPAGTIFSSSSASTTSRGGVVAAIRDRFEHVRPTGDRLICHGALHAVPWKVAEISPTPEPVPGARLYGSLHEAAERFLADLAEEAWLRDYLTALLGRASKHTASFLEAAWHAHAGGFVSHLGESAEAPRYHAPDAPAVLVDGLPRSRRHGDDADLDPDREPGKPGRVRCRTAGRVVTAVNATVGSTTWTIPAAGFAVPLTAPGLPAATAALLDEAMALDHGNVLALAARVSAAASVASGVAFSAAVAVSAAWAKVAAPDTPTAADAAAARACFVGALPMPFAAKGHWPRALPLYAELSASIASDVEGEGALPTDWRLGVIDLERTEGSAPTLRPPVTFAVRRVLTPVIARMLGSVTAQDVFRAARILACTLPEVDRALPAGVGVRAGQLRLDRLRVIDTFGRAFPIVGPGASAGHTVSHDLVPRLAGWARLHARLLDRATTAVEASDTRSPVCGFVLADRVDHALEVFDAGGARVGQLRHHAPGAAASVVWEPDPARKALDASRAPGEPERVLAAAEPDGVLLDIVRGLLAAQAAAGTVGGDTALSALIRALDALQSTAARTASGDEIGPLLGRPLAVVRVSARLERVVPGASDPRTAARVAEAPAPATFTVPLAFGALTCADDGVFGGFLDGIFTRFLPVDGDAISPRPPPSAIPGGDTGTTPPAPVAHPYLAPSPVVTLAAGQPRIATLLVDPRLAIHVRTGVLPAKRIAMPTTMYQPALRDLSPSIRVGPVLLPPAHPWLPTPYLPGGAWRWLHVAPVAAGAPVAAPIDEPLAAPAASAGLPEDGPVAQDGWLRRVPAPRP